MHTEKKSGIVTERKLTNQRQFVCGCAKCRAKADPVLGKIRGGKWWQAHYGESTAAFFNRVRAEHGR